jgi:hypothetical protein
MMRQNPRKAIRKAQAILIAVFIIATTAVNSIVVFAGDSDVGTYFGIIIGPTVAAVAAAFALIVVYRQRLAGIFGITYASLAAGLVFYFIAEVLWAYYSIWVGIEVPFPSAADAFWLAAYVPFGYGLFKLSFLYGRHSKANMKSLIVMGVAVAAFSSYYVAQLVSLSEFTGPESGTALAIGIAYPILDAVLIVPALLAIISGAGKGYLTSVPWIFVSFVFTAVADTLFGFGTLAPVQGNEIPSWNFLLNADLFYNTAYLSMAAGMYWHNKYMIFDNKRALAPVNPNG